MDTHHLDRCATRLERRAAVLDEKARGYLTEAARMRRTADACRTRRAGQVALPIPVTRALPRHRHLNAATVRALLRANHLTNATIAAQIGIAASTWSRLIHGARVTREMRARLIQHPLLATLPEAELWAGEVRP